ncbi:MAG: cation-transporting P-type ATPase [Gaiellaceae bacterium]|nr:cation-transporting P-type ATPase [Gaiellaceae bacterium]
MILLVAGIVTLAFGQWQDALFLGILVANSGIGIGQELRAKRALDRLAALVAPTAHVVRGGQARDVPVEGVVEGDLVRVQAGDQIVADGTLVDAAALSLDESILTGEAEPVDRRPGEEVRSGSFAVDGTGAYEVTAVGERSYAERLAGEAREFRHPRSPLEHALNRLLLALVAVMVPLALVLGYALWDRKTSIGEAVPTSVAAVVTMVPEGLILLASVTYAVGALRMARRGALAQQLNAVESIASVDVVCMDKTGTLTEPGLTVARLVPAAGTDEQELRLALGRYAASSPGANSTLRALAESLPGTAEPLGVQIPFSSRRRWGALELADGAYVLGAPELFPLGGLGTVAEAEARQGRRVLVFARTDAPLLGDATPPPGLDLLGLVVVAERLRPEARQTVDYFAAEGVALVVLSGDRPDTVASIAADAGVETEGPIDGGALPDDPAELRRLVLEHRVVGRITPEGKRRVVEALRDGGRYVAMIGDGVNDVPALKAARLAIAQGSGAQMARSVSDLVLVRGDFAALPAMVGEGRKILRNLQRVAKLFVTKSVFAVFLILSIGLTPTAYPLLPRHLTLAAAITIGLPSIFLALAPSSGTFRTHGFLREVARFAVPAGTAAGLGVLSGYLLALNVANVPLGEARTVATTVLVAIGLYLILALEAAGRRRGTAVSILCGALAALYLIVLAVPGTRSFFALQGLDFGGWVAVLVGSGLAIGFLWITDDRFVPGRPAA